MDTIQKKLPTPRSFVASIISALDKATTPSANSLTDKAASKELLLTLHVLFTNELLPALDLLDRGLVTRLRGRDPLQASQAETSAQNEISTVGQDAPSLSGGVGGSRARDRNQAARLPYTYYVRSAQQQQASRSNSRFRNAAYEQITYYEVRLQAWSCSCPAFAFSAFPATFAEHHETQLKTSPEGVGVPLWTFGGLSRGEDMPVCKHLLACVLVEHGSMFADMVEERAVSVQEMVGWAAGWGD